MSVILQTIDTSSMNLTTEVFTTAYTADIERLVCFQIYLSGLNTTASSITIRGRHKNAADTVLGDQIVPYTTMTKSLAANTTIEFPSTIQVLLAAGEKVDFGIISNTSDNTAVTASVKVIDVIHYNSVDIQTLRVALAALQAKYN